MTINYTDQQLKLALAKMLPEVLEYDGYFNHKGESRLLWQETDSLVKDTELLHLCWMVEETLTRFPKDTLSVYYRTMEINYGTYGAIHATWQQRTIVLAATKGIEVV